MRIPLLMLALLLAGCAQAPDETTRAAFAPDESNGAAPPEVEPPSGPANASAAGPVVLEYDDRVTSAVSQAGGICSAECVNAAYFRFTPDANLTAVLAELRWEGPMDLDLSIGAADSGLYLKEGEVKQGTRKTYSDKDGTPGAPDVLVRILIDDPTEFLDAVEWRASIQGKAAADVAFELRISLFPGEPPAEDYSAFTP